MIKLFAIDDHFLIIEGLTKTFNPETDGIGLVGSALSINEALQKIPHTGVDIILLDLFLGNEDPVANFRQLHAAFPDIPVVMLTMEDSRRWQAKMFKLGVMGYLTKSESKEAMKRVLGQVAQGNLVMPSEVSQSIFKQR
jgi:DNA-binding NarL/FixJ family response regulator